MISSKPYRCVSCHKVFSEPTNHFGEIYDSPCCHKSAECIHHEDGSAKTESEFKNVKKGARNIERMKSKQKLYREDGHKMKHVVKYGFHYLVGNNRPSFSVTSDITRNGRDDMGGCCHEEVAKHFPEIAHLIKWHLVDDDATPMHYMANGAYWLEFYHNISRWTQKERDPNPLEAFKRTVVFGAVETDEAEFDALLAPLAADELEGYLEPARTLGTQRNELKERVESFCLKRLPRLREVMLKEMTEAGIEYIKPEEYQREVSNG